MMVRASYWSLVETLRGGDFERFGQGFVGDDERVVARAGHGAGNAGEDRFAVVLDLTGLAVHQLLRADDFAAEGRAQRLMSEADSEDGRARGRR